MGQNPRRWQLNAQIFAVLGRVAHPQKASFEAVAFEVVHELALDVVAQGAALRGQPVGERRVVRVDELV